MDARRQTHRFGSRHQVRYGFSLVELIAVLSVLGLLLVLTLAGVQRVRAAAAKLDCQNRLRNLALATQNHQAARGTYPYGISYPFSKTPAAMGYTDAGVSWLATLLPYIEQSALHAELVRAGTADPSMNGPEHLRLSGTRVAAFRCPADSRVIGEKPTPTDPAIPLELVSPWGLTNYLGVTGNDYITDRGMFSDNKPVTPAAVKDGTSNTIMIGERPTGPNGRSSAWYPGWGILRAFDKQLLPVSVFHANSPISGGKCRQSGQLVFQPGNADDVCDIRRFWSLHSGGANFAFADGSVRFLNYSAASILPALATRAGGEAVRLPE